MSRRKVEPTVEVPEPLDDAPSNVVPIASGEPEALAEPEAETQPEPEPEPEPELPIETAPLEKVVNWRTVTTVRTLKVPFADAEKESYTQELARSVDDLIALESKKKASASYFKTQIEELEVRQRELSHKIKDGWDERSVRCEWRFQCAGRQKDGEYVFHPEKKALVRLDTGDVVEIQELTEHDYNNHQELALNDEQSPEGEQLDELLEDTNQVDEPPTDEPVELPEDTESEPEDDITY